MSSYPPAPGQAPYDREVATRAQQQDVVTPSGQVVAQNVAVSEVVDNVEARRSTAYWVTGLVYFVFGVLEIAIALRVLLRLMAAAPEAGFSRFIYGVTGPFVAPFNGIVGEPAAGGGSVLDLPSILAIIVYLILSWIVAKILQFAIDRPVTGVTAARTTGRRDGL